MQIAPPLTALGSRGDGRNLIGRHDDRGLLWVRAHDLARRALIVALHGPPEGLRGRGAC